MKCPFLEKVEAVYCKAFPVKKMIPVRVDASSQCLREDYKGCSVYKSSPMVIEFEKKKKETEEKYCVWLKQEIISYRLCTLNYNCERYQFEQMIADINGKYKESKEVIEKIKELLKLPSSHRKCKYMLMSNAEKIPCDKDYECWQCETYIKMRELITAK